MKIKRQGKSWKAEAIYFKERVEELQAQLKKNIPISTDDKTEVESKTKTPVTEDKTSVANTPVVNAVIIPKELKKVEPQAPQEQKNTLTIEEEPEVKEEKAEIPKQEEKEEEEEFAFECPECSKQFNELNNGCCPYCNEELENAD